MCLSKFPPMGMQFGAIMDQAAASIPARLFVSWRGWAQGRGCWPWRRGPGQGFQDQLPWSTRSLESWLICQFQREQVICVRGRDSLSCGRRSGHYCQPSEGLVLSQLSRICPLMPPGLLSSSARSRGDTWAMQFLFLGV